MGQPLADYMSTKIWLEFDAHFTLASAGGQEIGGSRAGMALRDLGRIAQLVLDDGVVDGQRVLPEGWVDQAAQREFDVPASFESASMRALGLTGYGFYWWLTADGGMMAMGHSGQRL